MSEVKKNRIKYKGLDYLQLGLLSSIFVDCVILLSPFVYESTTQIRYNNLYSPDPGTDFSNYIPLFTRDEIVIDFDKGADDSFPANNF